MENKTAMQQMIEVLNEAIKAGYIPDKPIITKKVQAPFKALLIKATELLEVEKKNIVEAYKYGGYNYDLDKGRPHPIAEEWFDTKFNNQK